MLKKKPTLMNTRLSSRRTRLHREARNSEQSFFQTIEVHQLDTPLQDWYNLVLLNLPFNT